ncbi:MAG: response regulator [Limisphaerales bacterium]
MHRKKILIADDNAVIVKSLSMRLSASGYDIVAAQDGAATVSTVRQERPDLILLDLSFPHDGGGIAWDGFLVLDWLRRMDEARYTPIVIISRSDPDSYRERALAAGVLGFFQKPINMPELLAFLDQVFRPK